jgi:N-acyl-D-aspartate/D-glutamate deacylase
MVPIHPLRVADPRSGAGRNSKNAAIYVDEGQPATGARLREAQHGAWNKDVGGSCSATDGRFLMK